MMRIAVLFLALLTTACATTGVPEAPHRLDVASSNFYDAAVYSRRMSGATRLLGTVTGHSRATLPVRTSDTDDGQLQVCVRLYVDGSRWCSEALRSREGWTAHVVSHLPHSFLVPWRMR